MKTSGLDVHKDSIFCAICDGKSYFSVKEFSTTTVSIRELCSYLKSEKVEKVAIESTCPLIQELRTYTRDTKQKKFLITQKSVILPLTQGSDA